MDAPPSRPRLSRTFLGVSAGIALVMLAAAIAFYIVVARAPGDLARNLAQGVREIFDVTPQVRIDRTTVIEQSSPILEVATLSRGLHVDHTWTHSWLGSTKTIQIQGTFTAKAGFDLRQPFTITIERGPLRVTAGLPPPKLLSVEMTGYRIVRDESGWWNRISDADRERAVRELQAAARAEAEGSGILEEARATAEDRVRELVQRNGAQVVFALPGPD